VHIELARALVPVVHDLTVTGGPVPRVFDDGWAGPGFASAMLWDDASTHGSGVSVELGTPRHEQLARVAGQVQDWASEELHGTPAANWPPCPEHPGTHPLEAAVRDGAARWSCPETGAAVAAVGGLR